MWVEFVSWSANTEVKLIDDDGRVEDTFYTSLKEFLITPIPGHEQGPFEAKSTFQLMEEWLPKPVIAGPWGNLHPYWHEREAKRNGRIG